MMTSARRLPIDLVPAVAEGALSGRIELGDAAFVIHRHDTVQCRVQDRCLASLAAASVPVLCTQFTFHNLLLQSLRWPWQLSGPLHDPLIEYRRRAVSVRLQEPRLLQSDRRLIGRHAQ